MGDTTWVSAGAILLASLVGFAGVVLAAVWTSVGVGRRRRRIEIVAERQVLQGLTPGSSAHTSLQSVVNSLVARHIALLRTQRIRRLAWARFWLATYALLAGATLLWLGNPSAPAEYVMALLLTAVAGIGGYAEAVPRLRRARNETLVLQCELTLGSVAAHTHRHPDNP